MQKLFISVALLLGCLFNSPLAVNATTSSEGGRWEETINVKNEAKTYQFNEDEIIVINDSFKWGQGIGEQDVNILYVGFVMPQSLLNMISETESGTNLQNQDYEKIINIKFKEISAIRFDYKYCNKYAWSSLTSRSCSSESEKNTFRYEYGKSGYNFSLIDKPDVFGTTGVSIKNYNFSNVAPFVGRNDFQSSIVSDDNSLTIMVDNITLNSIRAFDYTFRVPTSEVTLGKMVYLDYVSETEEIIRVWVKQDVHEVDIDKRNTFERFIGNAGKQIGSFFKSFTEGLVGDFGTEAMVVIYIILGLIGVALVIKIVKIIL